MRCTCNEPEAAEGLARIVPRSPVPIVADIHHQYRRALEALEAGVHCLRLNPGNIRRPEHIKTVAQEAKDRGVPIRIGVNGGSLDDDIYRKYGGRVTPEALVESAQREIAYFDEVGFDLVKISVKASSVPLMIEAYRQLAEVTDYPLHLGVTEAGPPPAGLIKSTAGIATLLAEGIGDTIRYSLTADPSRRCAPGAQLLEAMGLRERKNVDLIACPSCGRAEIDVYKIAQEAQAAFADRLIPLQVAVMGCVVNGPGEARDADLGIAAGNKRGHLFVKGINVAVVPEDGDGRHAGRMGGVHCRERSPRRPSSGRRAPGMPPAVLRKRIGIATSVSGAKTPTPASRSSTSSANNATRATNSGRIARVSVAGDGTAERRATPPRPARPGTWWCGLRGPDRRGRCADRRDRRALGRLLERREPGRPGRLRLRRAGEVDRLQPDLAVRAPGANTDRLRAGAVKS